MKVGHKEDHLSGAILFEQFAADDGAAGSHHVVHHDEVLALNVGKALGREFVDVHGEFAFTASHFAHHQVGVVVQSQSVAGVKNKAEGALVGCD